LETISIIGIGKLGLCFALNLERVDYRVIGVDVNADYVQQINNKSLHSYEPLVNEYLQQAQNLQATTNLTQAIDEATSLIFILVATPTNAEGGYDHYQLDRVIQQIIALGKSPTLRHLVVGCTTMPGYCDVLAAKIAPYNYTLSYNPEFIAQGTIIKNQQYPDQVLIGEANNQAGKAIAAAYKRLCKNEPTYCHMSRLSAEICKLATNCFLTTKISFANAIGDLATKVGAEPDKILAAVGSDRRIGGAYLKYGFGFGGPCFPRDNRALGKFAQLQNYELLISNATDIVNKRHLNFQVQQYLTKYNAADVIVFEGVSYKKGAILIEESQQLALAVALAKAGRKVLVKDQQAVITQVQDLYGSLMKYEITDV